jgi:hypothetical protein
MNHVSQRPVGVRAPFLREGLVLALCGGLVAAAGGCPGQAPVTAGGAGGEATTTQPTTTTTSASTSQTGTTSVTTTSDTASTGSVTTSSSSTDTMSVTLTTGCDPSSCQPQNECEVCDTAKCQVVPMDAGTKCTQGGGSVCDGNGACVECIADAQCLSTSTASCTGFKYQGKACDLNAHKCVDHQTDCRLTKQICSPLLGCTSCTTDLDCRGPNVADPCAAASCIAGLCEPPVGAACNIGGSGTTPGTCSPDATCVNAKYVFVTSTATATTGVFPNGPDDFCRAAAAKKGFKGNWVSWTSDASTTPIDRFTFKTPSVPFKLLTGVVVANDWNSLISGSLHNPITVDENGKAVTAGAVWTGTNPDGTRAIVVPMASTTCDDWSSATSTGVLGTVIPVALTPGTWSNYGSAVCSKKASLYCFAQ